MTHLKTETIQKYVIKLKKKYHTSNPFKIAEHLNIQVLFEDLGSIHGYYNKQLRMKQIHINKKLPPVIQYHTCAHELGHAILHPHSNTIFLRNDDPLSVNDLEREASTFAILLMLGNVDRIIPANCDIGLAVRVMAYYKWMRIHNIIPAKKGIYQM